MSTAIEIALLRKIQEHQDIPLSSSNNITTTDCSHNTASFAQQLVWSEEQLYHDRSISLALNNLLLPLEIKHGLMSIARIRSAIVAILKQHMVLRTAIIFDEDCGKLKQAVQPVVTDDSYSFQLTRKKIQSSDEIGNLLKHESINHFAQLDRGLVVRCHLIKIGSDDDDAEKLYPHDLIIFVFHRIAFDYNSAGPFITAFTQAYDQIKCNVTGIQYIDFTSHEHQQLISVTPDSGIQEAHEFWSKMMDDYSLNENYPLPITSTFRNKVRSGQGYSTSFVLDSNLVEAQIEFASVHDVSMFHVGLACYFLLVYELNDGRTTDLCVACPTENRPLADIKLMIGTFSNLLPYRIKINANDCFINFVQHIRQLDNDIHQHFQLPYQQIIGGNKDLRSTKIPFHFHYDSIQSFPSDETAFISKTKDATLTLFTDQIWLHGNDISSNDFTLKMIYNQSSKTTHCIFECSTECYDEARLCNISQRFQDLLLQIFVKNTETTGFEPTLERIGNLSLQQTIFQKLSQVFQQLPNDANTSKSYETKYTNHLIYKFA
jgi:hypothetical protein